MSASSVAVLYQDYKGYWRPLDCMYFSSDSQCLVSDHPESMQQEVESFYCGQCNFFCVEAEAQGYGNRCPHCFSCPACGSVLAITAAALAPPGAGSGCCFRCSFCQWTSAPQGLVEEDADVLAMTVMRNEREDPLAQHFADLLSSSQRGAAAAAARNRAVAPPRAAALKTEDPRWCVADLEAKRAAEAASIAAARLDATRHTFLQGRAAAMEALQIAPDTALPSALTCSLASADTVAGLTQRLRSVRWQGRAPAGAADFDLRLPPPLRLPLRAKLGKRCRKDLEEGRSGILVKPKVHPLEGDSSMAAKHGQWFKKDSSAVQFIPRVLVSALPALSALRDAAASAPLLLRVSNPLPAPVRVTIAPAGTRQEPTRSSSSRSSSSLPKTLDLAQAAAAPLDAEAAAGSAAVLQLHLALPEGSESVEVALQGKEDEYLSQQDDTAVKQLPTAFRIAATAPGACAARGATGKASPEALAKAENAWAEASPAGTFYRDADTAWVRVPVSFGEAALGGEVAAEAAKIAAIDMEVCVEEAPKAAVGAPSEPAAPSAMPPVKTFLLRVMFPLS